MSKYFMQDTPLFVFEAMMMERPRSYRDYGSAEQPCSPKKDNVIKERRVRVDCTADHAGGAK